MVMIDNDSNVQSALMHNNVLYFFTDVELIDDCIKSPQKGKAGGPDNIRAEHVLIHRLQVQFTLNS